MIKILYTFKVLSEIIFSIGVGGFLFFSIYSLNLSMPIPVYVKSDPLVAEAKTALYHLGAPTNKIEKFSVAIGNAAKLTDFSPTLLVALMYTESTFKETAVSPKNYKGLMQTPKATFVYSDVDILYGSRILRDKMSDAKGDLPLALALYKGGNNPAAKRYAKECLQIYNNLKKKRIESDSV
jgi:soluble lytic murein transglycosylase-like protein